MVTRRDALSLILVPAALSLTGSLSMNVAHAQGKPKGEAIPTSDGEVTLTPVNHASLVVGYGDAVIYVDPVGGAELYSSLPKPTAILLTHGHPDHFDVPTLQGLGAETIGLTAPRVVIDALPDAMKAKSTLVSNGDTSKIG